MAGLLRLAGLARSTFYYQAKAQQRPDKYAALKQQVQRIYHAHKGLYGYRRVASVVRSQGTLVNKKVVERCKLVGDMLEKALERLPQEPRLVMHSDQGWHYQQQQYRHMLRAHGVKQSMSRKGNCLDNAAMESFFGTLKSEFFYLKRFESVDELKAGLDEYIHYYNHERIKLKLKGLSPVDYRAQATG